MNSQMGSKLNGVNYQVVAVETFLSRDGMVGEGGKVESFGGANREDTNKQFQAVKVEQGILEAGALALRPFAGGSAARNLKCSWRGTLTA